MPRTSVAQVGQGLAAGCARLGQQFQRQVGIVPDHLLGEADVHAQRRPAGPAPRRAGRVRSGAAPPRTRPRPGSATHSAGRPARPSPSGSGPAATTLNWACAFSTRGPPKTPTSSRPRKSGSCLRWPARVEPQPRTAGRSCRRRAGTRAAPERHADRHVDQGPQQVPPGRGVGQQPLAPLQPADQPIADFVRPGPVGRGDAHARPFQREAALLAGPAAHAQQGHRQRVPPRCPRPAGAGTRSRRRQAGCRARPTGSR